MLARPLLDWRWCSFAIVMTNPMIFLRSGRLTCHSERGPLSCSGRSQDWTIDLVNAAQAYKLTALPLRRSDLASRNSTLLSRRLRGSAVALTGHSYERSLARDPGLDRASRRLAHATYYASHGTDQESALTFAMDLTPLIEEPDWPVTAYVLGFIDRFRADVEKRVNGFL
jgi:hypothetical protein